MDTYKEYLNQKCLETINMEPEFKHKDFKEIREKITKKKKQNNKNNFLRE